MAPGTEAPAADCAGCGHRLDEHDRVALRYCEASEGHERRGCICRGLITTEVDARLAFSHAQG